MKFTINKRGKLVQVHSTPIRPSIPYSGLARKMQRELQEAHLSPMRRNDLKRRRKG